MGAGTLAAGWHIAAERKGRDESQAHSCSAAADIFYVVARKKTKTKNKKRAQHINAQLKLIVFAVAFVSSLKQRKADEA